MTVEIVTTGGSIVELFDGGTVRHLSGDDLIVELLRDSPLESDLRVSDLLALPSTWITPDDMRAIGHDVLRALSSDDVTGVVVLHGTATLEETSFFVDLMIDGGQPVVFTGAQRYPGEHGYDGYRNLQDAIAVAGSADARGLGALVVINGEIHLARDAVKTHATSMAAFSSPGRGPVGRVNLGAVRIDRWPASRYERLQPDAPLARVDLLTTYTGMDGALLEASIEAGAKGIVIQAMSSAGIPALLVPAVRAAVAAGIAIVITSRCIESGITPGSLDRLGIEGYSGELHGLGVAMSGLHGLKARCRLIALLSSGFDSTDAIREMDEID